MNWPVERMDDPPVVPLAEGYLIRQATADDIPMFLKLMHGCGWTDWDKERLDYCLARLIPTGWFVAVTSDSDRLVASAMCLHNYTGRSPESGTLGWVGCNAQHRGKRLGSAVTAAVTTRFLQAGYKDIELYTEHFRLPALHSYLRLGYVPYLYSTSVTEVWREVCHSLNWRFTPDQWPRGSNAFPT
ncbi:MAG: GNAT family N-acetyltransferase [Pirellulaceae bacterium]|nr:GNAT family N-acetyltransferase [Pirellulaceae bacterium]